MIAINTNKAVSSTKPYHPGYYLKIMRFGFIQPVISTLIQALCYLNSAEWVKQLTYRFACWMKGRRLKDEELRSVMGVGIDLHQILKWGIVLAFLVYGVKAEWAFWLTAYLLAGNLFTYFYYHTWGSGYSRKGGLEARRRRFVAFLLSVGFYLIAYAYLYQFHLPADIKWPSDGVNFSNALYGSVTTAFTLTHGDFTPLSTAARTLILTQLLNTFIFLTIIITDAVPRIEENNE